MAVDKNLEVLWYWPNIVGYARIITAFIAFFFMPINPWLTFWFYMFSFAADGLDGYLARLFHQSTRFGACLDMITDRFATACLCLVLARFYPDWTLLLQAEVALDLSSHYIQMYASLSTGKSSHKSMDETKSRLMRLYYEHRSVLATLCAGNEVFFVCAYMLHWYPTSMFWLVLFVISVPFIVLKQLINVIQLCSASMALIDLDTTPPVMEVRKDAALVE
ncbi:CDP-diacylglycerol--inositol 3-phosphatidyltransferase [Carpediemonas membranifera]|uniref:CDP-diacylglycerol--inositol 3-phosphatidyltransferase n=1 Tax=Carpediemonas membranifera TaxID=201153 RepID=A0A8J6E0U9_9EUKA|nr:CDP-diacylglycerol--inositol 3-phosphatidyltransferase [Carpediemonas membranifera]|eukprot:KAG9389812.1 CDP-diacylglycerol--inositol 3-phosphatidyltransferase [Carpediemonas membranifera]